LLGVTDIIDRNVVVLAPEERHRLELLPVAEHVQGRDLALTFGDDPMFDADGLSAMRVGPARDVTGGKYARRAGFQEGIHHDTTLN
jgi:hypothetical protein